MRGRVHAALSSSARPARAIRLRLSPCPRLSVQFARRLLRRDVDGAIHLPRAGGRRPEGERDGSTSGRPESAGSGKSASNGGGAAARLSGSRPCEARKGRGEAKDWLGTENAVDAGAERQPVAEGSWLALGP